VLAQRPRGGRELAHARRHIDRAVGVVAQEHGQVARAVWPWRPIT
jgi:hypothetical protein